MSAADPTITTRVRRYRARLKRGTVVVPVEIDGVILDHLAATRPELRGRASADRRLIGRAAAAALKELVTR